MSSQRAAIRDLREHKIAVQPQAYIAQPSHLRYASRSHRDLGPSRAFHDASLRLETLVENQQMRPSSDCHAFSVEPLPTSSRHYDDRECFELRFGRNQDLKIEVRKPVCEFPQARVNR